MAEHHNSQNRPANPRRKKRSKFQIFKEAYLPVLIAGVALLLILIIIIGSIVRAFQNRKIDAEEAYKAAVAAQAEQERQEAEAADLLAEAAAAATHFDYDKAIAALDRFTGDWNQFPEIAEKREQYQIAQNALVPWEDPQSILSLSFQVLIADSDRAFIDPDYGNSYKRHYVTTEEFHRILQQLYENNYILISTEDCFSRETDDNGNIYFTEKPLYLPTGKKPLLLTQTNVCYNLYMVDSDGDHLPDKDADGFANKLILDENGNIAASFINAAGQTETGAYDLVPILDSFIATHPDFSYKGAKAILALTGFDGLLGYRTDADAKEYLTADQYNQEVECAKQVYDALCASGYEFACYTYRNVPYGDYTLDEIRSDLSQWNAEVVPLLGKIDLFVFAQESDISTDTAQYVSDKHTVLKNEGFNLFVGFCPNGMPWQTVSTDQVRFGRILVTGSNLINNPQWFEGILDPEYVLISSRD